MVNNLFTLGRSQPPWRDFSDTRRFVQRVAAPAGRTCASGGWGCVLTILLALPVAALEAPSGLEMTFHDSFWEQQDDQWIARFRFLAPEIAEGADYARVADDFAYLCDAHALPALEGQEAPDQIVISIASRPITFGVTDPDTTQFFEAFTVDGDRCIWDMF
ncbi:MAG: DUF6497 family protein [Shimia sp.]